jgi:hypothetical protein
MASDAPSFLKNDDTYSQRKRQDKVSPSSKEAVMKASRVAGGRGRLVGNGSDGGTSSFTTGKNQR